MEESSEVTVTTTRVIEAARNMLQVNSSGTSQSEESKVRVLQAEVKKLKTQLDASGTSLAVNAASASGVSGNSAPGSGKPGCFYCQKSNHRAAQCHRLAKEFPQMNPEQKSKFQKYYDIYTKNKKTNANAVQSAPAPSTTRGGSKVTDLL